MASSASAQSASADDNGVPDRESLNKLTVAQLKELCSTWGLTVSGSKQVLIGRLRSSGGPPAKLNEGDLRSALPVDAGPWMKQCVRTWKLAPPYNAAVCMSWPFCSKLWPALNSGRFADVLLQHDAMTPTSYKP